MPGPLSADESILLFLTLVTMSAAALCVIQSILQISGTVLAPMRQCSRFSPPWERAIGQLFSGADMDKDGFLSVEEMKVVANATGEVNITDDLLTAFLNYMGYNETGLPVIGFLRHYDIGGNDTQVVADISTFGLTHELDYRSGDVNRTWLLVASFFIFLSVVEVRSMVRSRLLSCLAICMAMVFRPWERRWLVFFFSFGASAAVLVTWGLEESHDDSGSISDGTTHVRPASLRFRRAATFILIGAAALVVEARCFAWLG